MNQESRRVWTGANEHADQPEHTTRPQQHNMQSTFLDKLSPEVRVIIYGHLFGASEAITPTTWITKMISEQCVSDNEKSQNVTDNHFAVLERGIHTNILATNKQIYTEAIEVLYKHRIVCGSVARMQDLLQPHNAGFWNHVRRIQIHDCNEDDSHVKLLETLYKLHDIPRMRWIIVDSECLCAVNDYTTDDASVGTTVSKFAQSAKLGPIKCIDVGVYALEGKLPKVHIMNCLLHSLWSAVRNTPSGYDGLVEAMDSIKNLGATALSDNVCVWASQTSLRCWVDIQQQLLNLHHTGRWADLSQKASAGTLDIGTDGGQVYNFFGQLQNATRLSIFTFQLLGSGKHVLKDLDSNCSSELLSEVTEFLASNIAGCMETSRHVTQHPEYVLSGIRWRNRGGRTPLSYMLKQQSIALLHSPFHYSKEFVPDPNLRPTPGQNHLIHRRTALNWLLDEDHVFSRIVGNMDLEDPKKFTRLTHLIMALRHYEIVDPINHPQYSQDRDDWSADLLKDYICASNSEFGELDNVEDVCDDDISTLVWIVIELLARTDRESRAFVQSFRRDTPVPSDFLPHVDPYIAWTYGKLFGMAVRRFLKSVSLEETLAAQWVKDSTLWEEE